MEKAGYSHGDVPGGNKTVLLVRAAVLIIDNKRSYCYQEIFPFLSYPIKLTTFLCYRNALADSYCAKRSNLFHGFTQEQFWGGNYAIGIPKIVYHYFSVHIRSEGTLHEVNV